MTHPQHPHYTQCVSFNFFTTASQEIAYNFMCVTFMYFIPLLVIIVAYTTIMCEISRTSKSSCGESYIISGRITLRRSDMSNIARTRSRTLRMTIIIVAVYIWCCTPYVIITLWYMLDRRSAIRLPKWLQDTFFMMVVSNSCMNPIVYGSFAINFRENCQHLSCLRSERSGIILGSGISRTSGMAANARRGKAVHQNGRFTCSYEKEEKFSSADRPPSAARVSFSDSNSSRSQKFSFHSEPPRTNFGLAMDTFTSEPIRLSSQAKSTDTIELLEKKVHFHRYMQRVTNES